jgi:hypothetical protein
MTYQISQQMTFSIPNLMEILLLISKYRITVMEVCNASAIFTCYFYITCCSYVLC